MGSNLSLRGGGGGLGVLPQENLEIWSAPHKFTIFS